MRRTERAVDAEQDECIERFVSTKAVSTDDHEQGARKLFVREFERERDKT
jgi:hypothetical protein